MDDRGRLAVDMISSPAQAAANGALPLRSLARPKEKAAPAAVRRLTRGSFRNRAPSTISALSALSSPTRVIWPAARRLDFAHSGSQQSVRVGVSGALSTAPLGRAQASFGARFSVLGPGVSRSFLVCAECLVQQAGGWCRGIEQHHTGRNLTRDERVPLIHQHDAAPSLVRISIS